jgi:hypothetical protein
MNLLLLSFTAVSILFFGSHPFYVSRPVISPIANAPQCGSDGSRSHVGKEVLEFLPALTNFDSNGSVKRKTDVIGLAAPSEHCFPRIVFGSLFSSDAMSMSCRNIRVKTTIESSLFAQQAATTFGDAVSQSSAVKYSHRAAITSAVPKVFVVMSEHKQSRKSETDHLPLHGHIVPQEEAMRNGK